MFLLPVLAAILSAAFATALLMRFRASNALSMLAWGIAMGLFSIASLVVATGISGEWSPGLYKAFWLFGALLNVPWLAVGSIAMIAKRAIALAAFAAVIVGTLFAAYSVLRDPVQAQAFDGSAIPSSEQAWGDSPQRRMVNYYSIVPYFVVVGIAGWTSRPRRGMVPSRERRRGNLLIAVGVTIAAAGGSALRRLDDSGALLSVALALGAALMFTGFIYASRAPRFSVTDPGESPT